ncbi:MAG TPA: choice-of-anchor X domain-containing protein [Myxococcaceae bacterium]|nr:choice-of-anchor X domain-containing protein [Myxococcaceae bacterium]
MKKVLGCLLLAAGLLAGCGSSSSSCTPTTCAAKGATCGSISDGCSGTLQCGSCATGLACGTGSNNSVANVCGFAQPAGTVPVNFEVDDTANKNWKSTELAWKGSMLFDSTTRIITMDSTWGGPWALLYDDGPWNTGGHEPIGAVANDHKLGVTVFVKPPTTGTGDVYSYGLNDATNPDQINSGWVWIGNNGSFTVAPGATAAVTAAGMAFPAHGTIDLQLIIDTNALATGTWDTSKVEVKGSAWGWNSSTLLDDGTKGDATSGDGKYTYVMSAELNQSAPPYPGLLKSGDQPQFIFVFNGVEYKDGTGNANTAGVTAGTKASGASSFTPATIQITGGTGLGSGNTYITVP